VVNNEIISKLMEGHFKNNVINSIVNMVIIVYIHCVILHYK